MGRIISQKNKSKVIRAFRAPSAPVVMSLMALILIIGAPALVSMIDDSAQSEHMIPLGSYTEDDLSAPWVRKMVDAPADADMTFSYISGADNGGTHVFTLNTLANKAYVNAIEGIKIDNSVFDGGVSRVILSFDGSDVLDVRLVTSIPGESYSYVRFVEILDADGVGTNVFVCDLDSYQLTKIKANDLSPGIAIGFNGGFSGVFEMTSETYASTTIPYGEIIVGATGVLLIVCAILATPWVGTTGLTIRRRR